jgi:hypothetical protein
MRMKHLAVECPRCREWMSLAEFDITWTAGAGLTARDEVECPFDECALVFRIEGGKAIYTEAEGGGEAVQPGEAGHVRPRGDADGGR